MSGGEYRYAKQQTEDFYLVAASSGILPGPDLTNPGT